MPLNSPNNAKWIRQCKYHQFIYYYFYMDSYPNIILSHYQHTHDTHEGHKYPAATIPCCPGTGDDALEWLATHQPKYELVAVGLIGNLSTPSPGMSFRKLAMAFIALSPLLLLRPILCPFITHRDHD